MAREEKIKLFIEIFTFIMQKTIHADYRVQRTPKTDMCISKGIDELEKKYGDIGTGYMVDYCTCQIYSIRNQAVRQLSIHKIEKSIGEASINRYNNLSREVIYYEDHWLRSFGLSKDKVVSHFKNQGKNPYLDYLYPDYEDGTKRRAHNTEAGFFICQSSTLLWTPFSKVCLGCKWQQRCKEITKEMYPGVYTARVNEYLKQYSR